MSDFVIRDAVAADVPALAQLHVDTFIETHRGRGPTYQLRESQWRQCFNEESPNWFCYVIVDSRGSLYRIDHGIRWRTEQDLPAPQIPSARPGTSPYRPCQQTVPFGRDRFDASVRRCAKSDERLLRAFGSRAPTDA